MDKASDAEKERCLSRCPREGIERLKISKEKQKDMTAELRFYQDKEMREEEALEESTKASAQSERKRQAEEGDEEVILTKAL